MKPAVFVMTDVVGSTALWEKHGDVMRQALEVHDGLVHGAVEAAGGRVFKHTGDGMIAAFDEADGAVAGSLDAVELLAGEVWGATGPLEVRVSVHAGTASERDGDFFGPPVNKVARINGVGHGGQVLVSGVARELMSQPAGVDLGVHQLRDLSEPVRLWQLDDGVHPVLRTLQKARHNLPVMPTEFIGRATEIDELRALVDHHRLVTITGVGGCGKTRLAVEVGAVMADKFPGGVWFADLAVERNGDKVGDRVNDALGVVEPLGSQHSGPVGVLDEATGGLATLVIMDNCEHLIDDVAEFAAVVLPQAPAVSLLATSREALTVDGEWVWRIPNLHDAAVELFVDRGTAAGVNGLTDHLDQIEEICARLDDIPLAIELAAARVSSLSVDGLAARLDDRFSLLGGGRGRRRQQTLQTMMDWSYGLLDNDDQHVLNQLAVFSGTFPLSGVEAVVGATEKSVLDVLDSLVAQSLVVPSIDSGRYRLLETVRLYALDKLIAADEVTASSDKHLEWIRGFAGYAAGIGRPNKPGGNWQYEIDKLAEIDNIVAAMEWADETNNADAVFDLFRGAGTCWLSSGTLGRVAASWRDRIPQPSSSEPAKRAAWISGFALTDWNLGDSVRAMRQMLEAAAIVDTLNDNDPDGDWLDGVTALTFRGSLRDAERLSNLPRDPTGYARYHSALIKANASFSQWTEESVAATNALVDTARSVSQIAYFTALAMLGTQLYRIGHYDEAFDAALACLDAPVGQERVKIMQLPTATRPLTALGRYEEALDIIGTDFGPMLVAQRDNLRLQQTLSLVIMLNGLEQTDLRDHLAAISLKLGTNWDRAGSIMLALDDIFDSKEIIAALPEPDPTDLTADHVTALIADTIDNIRNLIAHPAPGTAAEASTRVI